MWSKKDKEGIVVTLGLLVWAPGELMESTFSFSAVIQAGLISRTACVFVYMYK